MFLAKFIRNLPLNNKTMGGSSYWILKIISVKSLPKPVFYVYIHNAMFDYKDIFNNKTTPLLDNNYQFTLYFLRKEVYYTKLKYSRVPQFDTSSGASASFMSGFYGFLVCEKFGFELIDSGDFFFLIIYIILCSLLLITLTQIANHTSNLFNSAMSLIRSLR